MDRYRCLKQVKNITFLTLSTIVLLVAAAAGLGGGLTRWCSSTSRDIQADETWSSVASRASLQSSARPANGPAQYQDPPSGSTRMALLQMLTSRNSLMHSEATDTRDSICSRSGSLTHLRMRSSKSLTSTPSSKVDTDWSAPLLPLLLPGSMSRSALLFAKLVLLKLVRRVASELKQWLLLLVVLLLPEPSKLRSPSIQSDCSTTISRRCSLFSSPCSHSTNFSSVSRVGVSSANAFHRMPVCPSLSFTDDHEMMKRRKSRRSPTAFRWDTRLNFPFCCMRLSLII